MKKRRNSVNDYVKFLIDNPGYYTENELNAEVFGYYRNRRDSNKKYADLLRRAWAKDLVERRVKPGTKGRFEWTLNTMVLTSQSGEKNFPKLLQNRNNGVTFTSMKKTHTMKKTEFTAAEIAHLNFFQGTRKPDDWEEVRLFYWGALNSAEKATFLKLPIINAEAEGIISPFTELSDELADQQYFILAGPDGDFYFIDTQGFNYCRYVAEIEAFPGEEERVAPTNEEKVAPTPAIKMVGSPLIMQNIEVELATVPAGKFSAVIVVHMDLGETIEYEFVDYSFMKDGKDVGYKEHDNTARFLETYTGRKINDIMDEAFEAVKKHINLDICISDGKEIRW